MIPPSWKDVASWMALVAKHLNPILQGYPYMRLADDPDDVEASFTYFNTTSGKVRTFDGTGWNDHW